MANQSWISEFPEMERTDLVALRKLLDGAYRDFSRSYGDGVEAFFSPLLHLLVWFEKLLLATPWLLVLAVLVGIAYWVSRSVKLTMGVTPRLPVDRVFRHVGRHHADAQHHHRGNTAVDRASAFPSAS